VYIWSAPCLPSACTQHAVHIAPRLLSASFIAWVNDTLMLPAAAAVDANAVLFGAYDAE
jgi:hypothetical protein